MEVFLKDNLYKGYLMDGVHLPKMAKVILENGLVKIVYYQIRILTMLTANSVVVFLINEQLTRTNTRLCAN